MPFDLWVLAGNPQHALVDVDPGCVAEFAGDKVDPAGYHPGSTGNIEHTMAIPATGGEDEIIGPRLDDLKCETCVGCRFVVAQLETARVTYRLQANLPLVLASLNLTHITALRI